MIAPLCIVVACSLSGCANGPFYVGPDLRHGTEDASRVDIVYRLDASRLNLPVAVARVEGQLVSYEEVAGTLSPDRTIGRLRIVYPCAEAPADFARAEVQIDAAPLPKISQLDNPTTIRSTWLRRFPSSRKSSPDASHETWILDLPKAELDELMAVLASPGRVRSNDRHAAGADLTTTFNGHQYCSACQPVPELDALMRCIRDHGQLVSYSHPLTAQSRMIRESSAVALFRDAPLPEVDGQVDPGGASRAMQLAQTSGLSAPNASRVVYLLGDGPTTRR